MLPGRRRYRSATDACITISSTYPRIAALYLLLCLPICSRSEKRRSISGNFIRARVCVAGQTEAPFCFGLPPGVAGECLSTWACRSSWAGLRFDDRVVQHPEVGA